jgi:hypothetical protein
MTTAPMLNHGLVRTRDWKLIASGRRVVARLGACLACGETSEYFVYDALRHTPKQARAVFVHDSARTLSRFCGSLSIMAMGTLNSKHNRK